MKCYFFLPLFLLLVSSASASYIEMRVQNFSSNFVPSSPGEINLSVSNFGDERAYEIHLGFVVPEELNSNTVFLGVMEPNTSLLVPLTVDFPERVLQGEYCFNLVLFYADGNDFPFSMANPVQIVYGRAAESMVKGEMEDVDVRGEDVETLRLELTNFDVVDREARVTLYGPGEINVDSPSRKFLIPGGSEALVEWNVSSLGALPDSSYLVFAVTEYEDQLHYSSVARAHVNVNKYWDFFVLMKFLVPAATISALVYLILNEIKLGNVLHKARPPKKRKSRRRGRR